MEEVKEEKSCPDCEGTGTTPVLSNHDQQYTEMTCRVCGGYGFVDIDYDD